MRKRFLTVCLQQDSLDFRRSNVPSSHTEGCGVQYLPPVLDWGSLPPTGELPKRLGRADSALGQCLSSRGSAG